MYCSSPQIERLRDICILVSRWDMYSKVPSNSELAMRRQRQSLRAKALLSPRIRLIPLTQVRLYVVGASIPPGSHKGRTACFVRKRFLKLRKRTRAGHRWLSRRPSESDHSDHNM